MLNRYHPSLTSSATVVEQASSPRSAGRIDHDRHEMQGPGTDQEEGYEMEEVTWGLLEALMWDERPRSKFTKDDDILSIKDALADLDGSASGAGSSGMPEDQAVEIPHFPALSEAMLREDNGARTSEPISSGIKKESEAQMTGLVDRKLLVELLSRPMGLKRFREWVEEEGLPGSDTLLQTYIDMRSYSELMNEVMAANRGIRSIYSDARMRAGRRLLPTAPDSQQHLTSATLSMVSLENSILDRLYMDEFKRFIAGRISEGAKARIGSAINSSLRGDLAEVFCVADPRLPDQPLVLVSDAFCRLSEYPRSRLLGRNCRFLQGPQTDRDAVKLLKDAIEAGREHCSLLLNYTRTGKPFWNLLSMIPLRNAKGEVELLLGAQVNVTHALESSNMLDKLLGDDKDQSGSRSIEFSQDLLENVEKNLGGPSRLRQLVSPPSPTPNVERPTPNRTPTSITQSSTKSRLEHLRLSRRNTDDRAPVSLDPPPIMQAVPDLIREHMAAFSSAYAKLFVFEYTDRRISFLTPALLASLGHPIRSDKDRWSPALLGIDVIDLLVAETTDATTVLRNTVSGVIDSGSSHSIFAGIPFSSRAITKDRADGYTVEKVPFTRCLLHFAPMKNIQDQVEKYTVVVG